MISSKIARIMPVVQRYFSDKPVLRAWVFGSFSRGEESDTSDIDILVDYDNSNGYVSLLTMGGFLMDLTDLLGRKVDLVDNSGLREFARDNVERDRILIYERGN